MNQTDERKIRLEYPCQWTYKIIGVNEAQMRSAAAEIICDRSYSISYSRQSETAKYHCLNVKLLVESEDHRKALYIAFKAHPAVKVIL